MTHWSDEHLADLLTATFAAHEEDADPLVAHRLALATPPAPRRVWPGLVAAAVVVLLVAVTVQALRPDDRTSEPAHPVPTPTEAGHNRRMAEAEAESLLVNVPLPPRARPTPDSPTPQLRRLRAQVGDVDPSLTRTGWWIVPMSYDDLVAWYEDAVPDSFAEADGITWWTEAGTAAYTTPAVIVSVAHRGEVSTAMRVDVTLAARDDRTAVTYVPQGVTSVDLTRSFPYRPAPPPSTVTVVDRDRIESIVGAFNRLAGAPSRETGTACGSPVGGTHWYALTFHWPGHTLAVSTGQPLCGIGRSLTLDGTRLPATLEDGGGINATLEAAFAAVGGRAP